MTGRAGAALFALALLCLVTACGARPAAPVASGGSLPDVILITIDTLRADAVGFAGNRVAETPNLDRLAREGLVFDRAYASNVVTLPSHANILTGLYPNRHGVRDNTGFRLDPRFPTLATFLKEKGYATGAFVAALPLDSRYGLNQGFDLYDDRYRPGSSPYDFQMQERPGTEVVTEARRWYEQARGKKRFLWVHLYEPHAPYRAPPPFDERFPQDPYLGEVSAADAALEPLLSLARADGHTLVVMTGDHGEARGEHGELTHGLFAYEATLRVPLLLWDPGRIRAGRSRRLARHVDILPTVLDVVGAPVPTDLPGFSLLAADAGRGGGADYFEALSASLNRGWAPLTGVLDGHYKLVNLPIPELYDLDADPAEKDNLFDREPEVARRLKRLLPAPVAVTKTGDAEAARRLLALGYLSGSARPKATYTAEDDPKRLVEVDRKIHQVVDDFQQGKNEEALKLARQILSERPTMSIAYEFLAFLLQEVGRDREAAGVLRAAASRDLASEAMQVRLALILAEEGDSVGALRVLQPLSASEDPETQNALGIALADAGRGGEALAVFDRILQKHPSDAVTRQNRGITRLKLAETGEALEDLDRALAVNDKLPRAWNARGVALVQLGRPGEALDSWRRAIALDSKQYDALFNLALVADRQGDHAAARGALERFVATAPPGLYRRDLASARAMLRRQTGP